MMPDLDRDYLYIGVMVLILAGVAGAHNVAMDTEDAIDFGYCDTDLFCSGVEVSGQCIGVEQRSTQCYNISQVDTYRHVEAECGVQAYNLCQGNHTDTSWAEEATYQNRTCSRWAREDERITLLGCDQMYPSVQEWDDIR